ncbi:MULTISPECIES: twitching motility protein PilT [Pyrobaculum]|uniref:PilT protein domain protein n=2 Tax=Pyrobaculum arsenaticum TaxID=121277 RepID=A4WN64_PYRAR|nr:twitching motility protein PilT [Pyrobaculum arsenaticum]ABP51831.1 PilT protein domain protein [Pyrobaculum arsenaticum DSM 13514]MCY0891477.1 PIN domain nuclease [Pyrobaculum arsenaticum]NYR16149.1 PIN domain nuclease [Pyrobaculum arsenaticum]
MSAPCLVLDASAILHGRDARIFSGRLLTTREVAEELKDPRAQAALEILGVEVVEVDGKKVDEMARRFKELSRADVSVLLLALERRCTLITDDGRLAAAARRLGIRVEGVFYRR